MYSFPALKFYSNDYFEEGRILCGVENKKNIFFIIEYVCILVKISLSRIQFGFDLISIFFFN